MPAAEIPGTSRRLFLKRAAIAAAGATSLPLLQACSSTDSLQGAATLADDAGPVLLRNAFPDGLSSPSILADTGAQRAVFALQQDSRYLSGDVLPDAIDAVLTDPLGADRPVTLAVRTSQIPLHYLALVFEPTQSGLYRLSMVWEDVPLTTEFLVIPIDEVPLVHPGTAMPRLETPTTLDGRDVNPICTRDPICSFHELTVADALDAGKPFALMVSSPAFCTTGICGPTLEILINEAAANPDMNFVHVEVYTDPTQLGAVPRPELIAPTLLELGMTFEPSLIIVGDDGIIRTRLDASMDQHDISAALASASA